MFNQAWVILTAYRVGTMQATIYFDETDRWCILGIHRWLREDVQDSSGQRHDFWPARCE